ncbi:MAG: beta-ketoacyl synthase chain length factor [Methylococcaceae bacterium]|nr:beta-ketoacyl synthase chain length factor [Methylococcaceae bacterium]
MECLSLLGFGACSPDPELRESLSFPSVDIDRSSIPPLLRRRTSQATQMAFTAANRACNQANRSPAELPGIFASVGGEIQVTDRLCIELGKPEGVVSPTDFHNSVHNTAAAYWSIVHRCTLAVSALAAGHETFAMALLESWCQLADRGGELLLVCYDESWPAYLSAPLGEPAFACALVLGAGARDESMVEIGRPQPGLSETYPAFLQDLIGRMPVAAAIPLLTAAQEGGNKREIPLGANWQVQVKPLTFRGAT